MAAEKIYTTEKDVALDIVAALDMFTGDVGNDNVTIETVATEPRRDDRISLLLSNGDEYQIQVVAINN